MNKVAKAIIAPDTTAVDYLDYDLALFDRQYPLPQGMAYNTYIIRDEETVVIDGVDHRGQEAWMEAVSAELGETQPAYIIVQHLEPDHSGALKQFLERYGETRVLCTAKSAAMFGQFVPGISASRVETVKDGQEKSLGKHTLRFISAPMVHWPEVMMTFDATTGTLFSADAFGMFGCDVEERVLAGAKLYAEEWIDEARRYYCNIVGKYGGPVQAALKKVLPLGPKVLAPLHGPVLREDVIPVAVEKYQAWSTYTPEREGIAIFVASMHGATLAAMEKWALALRAHGAEVKVVDLTTVPYSYAVADAFEYSEIVLACASCDAGLTAAMEDFLTRLSSKGLTRRSVALVENGSWAPCANRIMAEMIGSRFRGMELMEERVSIRTRVDEASGAALDALAGALLGKLG